MRGNNMNRRKFLTAAAAMGSASRLGAESIAGVHPVPVKTPRSTSGGYDVLKICAVRMSVNTLVVEVALIGFAGSISAG